MTAASRGEGASRRSSGGRRVYRESQSQNTFSTAQVKQVASSVAPVAAFVVATFGMELFGCFYVLIFSY